MNKCWGWLFMAVPIGSVGLFAISPSMKWWWPPAISSYGPNIDYFYWLITVITTIAFVVTEILLACFVLRYRSDTPGRASSVAHSTALEIAWTLAPTAILVWLGIYQIGLWMEIKVPERFPKVAPIAEVTGRQFEWRIRYAGPDGTLGRLGEPAGLDDVRVLNDFHVPKGEPIRIILRSDDVLHSFFVPNIRLKQDAVPGMEIPVWFDANVAGEYDLVCAELCGWGHYKMRGRLVVQERSAFEQWLRDQREIQEASVR